MSASNFASTEKASLTLEQVVENCLEPRDITLVKKTPEYGALPDTLTETEKVIALTVIYNELGNNLQQNELLQAFNAFSSIKKRDVLLAIMPEDQYAKSQGSIYGKRNNMLLHYLQLSCFSQTYRIISRILNIIKTCDTPHRAEILGFTNELGWNAFTFMAALPLYQARELQKAPSLLEKDPASFVLHLNKKGMSPLSQALALEPAPRSNAVRAILESIQTLDPIDQKNALNQLRVQDWALLEQMILKNSDFPVQLLTNIFHSSQLRMEPAFLKPAVRFLFRLAQLSLLPLMKEATRELPEQAGLEIVLNPLYEFSFNKEDSEFLTTLPKATLQDYMRLKYFTRPHRDINQDVIEELIAFDQVLDEDEWKSVLDEITPAMLSPVLKKINTELASLQAQVLGPIRFSSRIQSLAHLRANISPSVYSGNASCAVVLIGLSVNSTTTSSENDGTAEAAL